MYTDKDNVKSCRFDDDAVFCQICMICVEAQMACTSSYKNRKLEGRPILLAAKVNVNILISYKLLDIVLPL